jgi:hypothetical protein
MASRPIFPPYPVIVNGNMASPIISAITVIQNLSMVSYDISWNGTSPVGVVTVQVSNTYSQNADGTVRNPGNWTALVLSGPTNVSGNTGTGFIDVDEIAAYAIRLVYTPTSGTGTMQATINCKVS